MIFSAYQTLMRIAFYQRTKPLSHDEQTELNRDINTIYMNLRGVLDNLAYCLILERQPSLVDELRRDDIGLFSNNFRKKYQYFSDIKNDICQHDDWQREVKERRDPVAHRIPLYVPHTSLTLEEKQRYDELQDSFHQKSKEFDLDGAKVDFKEMHKVGTFLPYFVHHPDEKQIPIYPTIPEDLAHLIEIADIVERALTDKRGDETAE